MEHLELHGDITTIRLQILGYKLMKKKVIRKEIGMFSLEYKIPKETRENLNSWKLEEFEEEIGEVEGQIKLDFNGKSYGYIDEGDSLFYNKFLIMWFIRLNECCNVLQTSKYVCFDMPETNGLWLEMNVRGDNIYIQRLKLLREVITCYVVDSPLEDFEYFDWGDTVIKKKEFIKKIEIVTQQFISEIYDLNSELLNAIAFNKLLTICNHRI